MRSGDATPNSEHGRGRPGGEPDVACASEGLETVCRAFADVLGLPEVGPDDDFVSLGGHSLAAMRLVARLRNAHGLAISVADILADPTPRAVVRHGALHRVAGEPGARESGAHVAPETSEPPTTDLDPDLRSDHRSVPAGGPGGRKQPTDRHPRSDERRSADLPIASPGTAVQPGDRPLRPAESAIWFMHRMSGAEPAYHEAVAVDVDGAVDAAALAATWTDLVAAHPIFTCTYPVVDGRPVRRAGAATPPALEIIGLRDVGESDLDRRIASLATRPFDLDRGPLIRGTVLLREGQPSTILVVMHHVICDEWTVESFFRAWSERLTVHSAAAAPRPAAPATPPATPPSIPADPPRRADHIAADLDVWRERLRGASPDLDLPAPRRRRATGGSSGRRMAIAWDADVRRAIDRLVDRTGATPYMVLMAGLHTMLARFGGRADHVVGMPSLLTRVDRGREDFGCFVNVLPLRLDLSDEPTFADTVDRTRQRVVEALRHGAVGLGAIVEATSPPRSGRATPLFSTALVVRDAPLAPMRIGDVDAEPRIVDLGVARFELTWSLELTAAGVRGFVEFATDIWTEPEVRRLADGLADVVRAAAADPDRPWTDLVLPGGEAAERTLDRRTAGPARDPRLDGTIDGAFRRAAAIAPNDVVVRGDGRALTWNELSTAADRVAARLQAAGVTRGDRVALELDRSVDLVAILLGVVRAGATYVPVDPDYPAERRAWMLSDCAARLLVVASHADALTPDEVNGEHDGERDADVPPRVAAADLLAPNAPPARPPDHGPADGAYVMYTSGSTGRPKGVLVPHRAVLRLVIDNDFATMNGDTVVLALAPISFDASTFEIWGPLLNGGRCVLDAGAGLDPVRLSEIIRTESVTTMWLTAALFNALIDTSPAALGGLRELLIGGEALSVAHVRRALDALPGVRIINGYGPTESTTFACTHSIPRGIDRRATSVPIGRPIRHTAVRIAGRDGRPQAPGEPGELWITGDGLATGYVDRPDLTAERFVESAGADGQTHRWYRTGDRVRQRPDGAIEFLGRFDDQVKIRGHRIEPGEIAAALRELRGVRDAAVIAEPGADGDLRLVAYVVPDSVAARDLTADCRAALGRRLPAWMQPTGFVALDELPATANGKLDRARLPRWTPGAAVIAETLDPGHEDAPRDAADAPVATDAPDADAGPGRAKVRVHRTDRPAATTEDGRRAVTPPITATEAAVVRLWSELFPGVEIDRHDDFFEIGGHSLLAVRLFAGIEARLRRRLPLPRLWTAPTPAALAAAIDLESIDLAPRHGTDVGASSSINTADGIDPANAPTTTADGRPAGGAATADAGFESLLVPLRSGDHRPPLFCIAGLGGHPVAFRTLAERLDPDRGFIGLAYPGFSGQQPAGETVEEIADAMLDAMRRARRHGPWRIAGYSLGGLVAYELARRLEAEGEDVDALILVDSYTPGAIRKRPRRERVVAHLRNLVFGPEEGRWAYVWSRMRRLIARGRPTTSADDPEPSTNAAHEEASRGDDRGASLESDWNVSPAPHLRALRAASERAISAYWPQPYGGSLQLIRCTANANDQFTIRSETNGWEGLVRDIDVVALSAMHLDVLEPPGVDELATLIEARLHRADQALTRPAAGDRPTAD